jgi:RimJ/RimL family protein N-acetyltransferase
MKRYRCLPRARIKRGPYAIVAVQPEHIESIRQWRNEQIAVLRQNAPITAEQQKRYYATKIWPAMEQAHPENILLSYFLEDLMIGYGGLVHIAWQHLRAEVSFLLEPSRAADPVQYGRDFSSFLELIQETAFASLGLRRLFTETYAGRDHHVSLLERSGFRREGVLRQHVLQVNKPVDSLIHGRLRSDAR